VVAGALVSAVKSAGLGTIGVLYTTDTSGTHQLSAAQDAAKTAGITVVSQPQTAGVTDVTPAAAEAEVDGRAGVSTSPASAPTRRRR